MCDSAQTRHRGDVDDAAAAAFEHRAAEIATQQERSEQVDIHHPLPLRGAQLFRWHDQADAGVIDQNIGRAEGFRRRCHRVLHEGLVGHIALERETVVAGRAKFREQGVGRLQIDQDEAVACRSQHHRGLAAEPLGCAGDDGGARVSVFHQRSACPADEDRL